MFDKKKIIIIVHLVARLYCSAMDFIRETSIWNWGCICFGCKWNWENILHPDACLDTHVK